MVLFEKAPAKINLSLDVLKKRDDGFHEVEMVMTTIDLSDRIELHPLDNDEIKVSLESRYVPNDERNLAFKAAQLMKETYNITKGIHIKLVKSIPVSAGLGGGSSDAAAVLRGLNRMWSVGIPIEDLASLGLVIGSDVPFCVINSTALVKGRGEVIEKLPSPPPCWVILAKPDLGVSTKTIFQKVVVENLSHPNTEEIVQALMNQDFSRLCNNLGNSLESVTLEIYPEVRRLMDKMEQVGASNVLMSGSGPTVYSLVEQESKAQRIYNGLRGFCEEVYKVRLLG
jgi:4-diphosphocytidyl-2-C-methyl-D-erythritol kinase